MTQEIRTYTKRALNSGTNKCLHNSRAPIKPAVTFERIIHKMRATTIERIIDKKRAINNSRKNKKRAITLERVIDKKRAYF